MHAYPPPGPCNPGPNPASADAGDGVGDESTFCTTCAPCLSEGYAKPDLAELHVLVDHVGPFHPGSQSSRKAKRSMQSSRSAQER